MHRCWVGALHKSVSQTRRTAGGPSLVTPGADVPSASCFRSSSPRLPEDRGAQGKRGMLKANTYFSHFRIFPFALPRDICTYLYASYMFIYFS